MPFLQVVVRKLPPGLTEEGFRAAVDKVAIGTYNWLVYNAGKVRWAGYDPSLPLSLSLSQKQEKHGRPSSDVSILLR